MSSGQFYIGYTKNIKRRITEHKQGKGETTKKYLPVKLIFCEIFLNKTDALRRESYFKTTKGRTTLRLMIREYLKNNQPKWRNW